MAIIRKISLFTFWAKQHIDNTPPYIFYYNFMCVHFGQMCDCLSIFLFVCLFLLPVAISCLSPSVSGFLLNVLYFINFFWICPVLFLSLPELLFLSYSFFSLSFAVCLRPKLYVCQSAFLWLSPLSHSPEDSMFIRAVHKSTKKQQQKLKIKTKRNEKEGKKIQPIKQEISFNRFSVSKFKQLLTTSFALPHFHSSSNVAEGKEIRKNLKYKIF